MWSAGGTRIWVEGGRGEVSDEVIVEGSALGCPGNGVALYAQTTACSDRAAHDLPITRVLSVRICRQLVKDVS